ncbi:cyclohexyl-isocyanide hydratase [Pseudomonas chlororaphis]|uniref:isonitrile hydratase n=1 Tax=Pseudomonas chlororaphis TaxID=587753 RepID=UPI00087923B5|nr:isonitrile hydratase [Pseudomonas chlororaphis]AZD68381.1 Isonitrile hydratase [Pseudomonas chlororaphis subsp. aurantiaca]AZD74591.1 Isonitrile hydratase [Pseudomonas chlororaphis subsp. aurantiaca]AZD80812.1 Isonitrile hydratase [Pseudomonas chlororaphis subsp. aurantiaca]QIT24273.1 DJ-1/PfpI family protein [Pseudomonas chlororaphis subsp. aurantiaca]WDH02388.1 DJ-1/PfpI family protein [Pseudomonas chlororaphis]
MTLQIGFLLFPNVQQLDLTGPYDVLASLPDVQVHLVWKTRGPVTASTGLVLQATTRFADCPPLDVICIPGGAGVGPLMEDPQTLDFIRQQAAQARYVTSVCTGSLVLGAAGLLRGKRATTHWAYHHLLEALGAIAVQERVVRDGNLLSGGGITAGIDFALTLAGELFGEATAQRVQLQLEYAPAPPFAAGSPRTAPKAVVEEARRLAANSIKQRGEIVDRVVAQWRQA